MQYKKLEKTNIEAIRQFIDIHDKAFLSRKNENNPYKVLNEENFVKKLSYDNVHLIVAEEQGEIVGGLIVSYKMASPKECIITDVCVDPQCQGKGIAYQCLVFAHKMAAADGCKFSRLSVGSVWKNAISLYKKVGYKLIGVGAHIPNTYYLMDFIKPLTDKPCPLYKRFFSLIKTSVLFFLLYKRDSTPRITYKIYKRIRKK